MNETEILTDFYKNLTRQGPGSDEDTLRALYMIDIRNSKNLKIADIGCGTGAQTMVLAEKLDGEIIAVDLFGQFLDELNERAKKLGFSQKIKTIAKSMDALPFEKEEFDIIWSEGAVYSMGFEAGIKYWHQFLKKGGYLAVSEIIWTTDNRPEEIAEFWTAEYPEIDTAEGKIKTLENNDYSLVDYYFVLSEESWMKNYYEPIENQLDTFLERHENSELAQEIVEEQEAEMDLYENFKEYFSYGFFVAKKN
jgi:ubiquinone/menaquinone biosynthesis C-methylase UbiE